VRRSAEWSISLLGIAYEDQQRLSDAMRSLQNEISTLPVDPFAQLPVNHGSSETSNTGELPDFETAPRALLEPVQGLDIVGFYAAGPMVRGMANSAGLFHWFATESFTFDYSIYTPNQKAVKETFAGRRWDESAYRASVEKARRKLELLSKPVRQVPRGAYRTYLEPAALHDLIGMLSWGAVSEASLQQGDSPLRKLRSGEHRLSPKFRLCEDFTQVEVPRFNGLGELAPQKLELLEGGELKSALISTRTAQEYKLQSNFAGDYEMLRAPVVDAGGLAEKDVLSRLGEGLYLSNLHYLNWSDQPGGRVTGMTRYACFWVENGKLAAPIQDLRWDDTIFNLFGPALEDLTHERAYLAETGTYDHRQLGGAWLPGALLSSMQFTL
jgi:predicted Zn-dependent protease